MIIQVLGFLEIPNVTFLLYSHSRAPSIPPPPRSPRPQDQLKREVRKLRRQLAAAQETAASTPAHRALVDEL
mgnify:CR=1 FL=1